LRGYHTGYDYF